MDGLVKTYHRDPKTGGLVVRAADSNDSDDGVVVRCTQIE